MAPPQKKDRSTESTAAPSKPLVILAKPPDKSKAQQGQTDITATSPPTQKELKPPTVLQKMRDGPEAEGSRAASPGGTASPSGSQTSSSKETEAFADFVKNVSQKVYHIQQKPSSAQIPDGDQKQHLSPEMTTSLKLIDESLQWCDNGLEYLQDGGDFYVIGVLGLQGVGKSTIMAEIAGCPVFKVQTTELKTMGEHCTSGIDVFVTNQRVILLDAQPLLSASVMDHMIQFEKYEKKPLSGSDYYSAESTLYIQSMQIVAFLMCVCHTVISVQDWFVDINYMRFLLSCEMLKPSKPMLQFDSKSEIMTEHFPHLVFVQNRAGRKEFVTSSVEDMERTLDCIFRNSKLRYTGVVQPDLHSPLNLDGYPSVNLFLLPQKDGGEYNLESCQFPEYKGRESFEHLSRSLARQILSMPRQLMTYFATSEKNWFYYASRIWDTVRKSNEFNEYRRHLISVR